MDTIRLVAIVYFPLLPLIPMLPVLAIISSGWKNLLWLFLYIFALSECMYVILWLRIYRP